MHKFKTKALVDMYVYICVCWHACVMFMQVCLCKSIWGVIASSLLVWENHTSSSLPNPCQGQDPLTALHCYFSMFVKCGVSMHMHAHTHTNAHRCCQFPSFQTPLTPKWDRVCRLGADNPPGIHTLCFTVPSQYQRLLINFLKRLFTQLNFSCLRVRVYQKQW